MQRIAKKTAEPLSAMLAETNATQRVQEKRLQQIDKHLAESTAASQPEGVRI
jgi:hypothetical protein